MLLTFLNLRRCEGSEPAMLLSTEPSTPQSFLEIGRRHPPLITLCLYYGLLRHPP
jgi:hypothetical protein